MKDDPTTRDDAPKGPDEWAFLWAASKKAHDSWIVTGPVVAIVRNWKAAVAVAAFVVWINRPEIAQALKTLAGLQ